MLGNNPGLVVLTDDGRVPEALLDPARKAPKLYEVDVDQRLADSDIAALAAGVLITTVQQRTGESTTAMTLPCKVERVFLQGKGGTGGGGCTLRFELQAGAYIRPFFSST